jgi:hypothetical protein
MLSPLRRIKLDRADAIADLLEGMEDEIAKLRGGLEVHGDDPEWQWWHKAVAKRDGRKERGVAKKAAKQARAAAGRGGVGDVVGGGAGGGGGEAPPVEGEGEDPFVDGADRGDEVGMHGAGEGRGLGHGHGEGEEDWPPEGERPSMRVFLRAWKDYMKEMAAEKKAKKKRKRPAVQPGGAAARKGMYCTITALNACSTLTNH